MNKIKYNNPYKYQITYIGLRKQAEKEHKRACLILGVLYCFVALIVALNL